MSKPHFIIKNNFQKGGTYKELLKPKILSDVCRRITGSPQYSVTWENEVNKGRMAILEHNGRRDYISFSEIVNEGRNSFFQSVPSALNQCILETDKNNRPYYYFLPIDGEYQTAYHKFMYRLLSTVGVQFLNQSDFLENSITPFASVEDIIRAREENRGKKKSNNSTYMTLDGDKVQIFAKVYGANKYESELFALASHNLTNSKIELFQIKEQDLKELPKPSKQVLSMLCGHNLELIIGDMTLEKKVFETGDSLRSPRYIYNLLAHLGPKKCALCSCDIPEIIQGAHIWGVSQIKRDHTMTQDEKITHATSMFNGLWLCENHHKLFDCGLIGIGSDGVVSVDSHLESKQEEFVRYITPDMRVPEEFMTPGLIEYLSRRYAA